jgi:hypothetical protein
MEPAMNGTSGFQEVRSSIRGHHWISSCLNNGINFQKIPGEFPMLRSILRQLTRHASVPVNHRIMLLCLSTLILLNGCSFSTLGYRPDFSSTVASAPACNSISDTGTKEACVVYYTAVKWGEEVAQAYRTKAFMDEWSFYMAGAVGIIGGALVGALTATEDGNTDAAKITPPVTAAVVALFALNQSDDKATAYGESITAIEESLAAADRHVSHNKTKEGFQLGSETLKDSIRQEIVNLDMRMVAIRKKAAASIPTTTALVQQPFKSLAQQAVDFTLFTKNLEPDRDSIRAIIFPDTAVTIGPIGNDRVSLTLTNPECRDYLVMLSVRNTLVLPARNLRCER